MRIYCGQVHATTPKGGWVVRTPAGKYRLAGPMFGDLGNTGSMRITFADAVRLASQPGAEVDFGLPGGRRFDAAVRRALIDPSEFALEPNP